LLWYAVNADFVLGAMYLYYVKGIRCEGLRAQSRLMAWVLWLPYWAPEALEGMRSWADWQTIRGHWTENKCLICTIDEVPHALMILECRCDATYNLLKYCTTTGECKLIPGFHSIEECQEYVKGTWGTSA
jgi:hypothetical protein